MDTDLNPEEGKGEGGSAPASEDLLKWLHQEVDLVRNAAEEGLWNAFLSSADTRYCRWDGQSDDCRKHAEENDDEEVLPFEGACDQRLRYADMVANEDVMLLVLSALRAQVRVTGVESGDKRKAGAMTLLLRYLLNNAMGFSFVRELIKLANYYTADSPAAGMMKVWWNAETALELKTLTIDELQELYLNEVMRVAAEQDGADQDSILAQAQAALEDFRAALSDVQWGEIELAGLLRRFFPTLRPARARKVVRQLRSEGRAEFPFPYLKTNAPAVEARRLFQDFFVPVNTGEFSRARVWFEHEWLSKAEVLERQVSQGWSDGFVTKLIGRRGDTNGLEGTPTFEEWIRKPDGTIEKLSHSYYRGLYQVATAYFIEANEDGVPGVYYVAFHRNIDETATDKRMLGYAHGGYPGHVFQREVLSDRVLDSRGVVELAGSTQSMLKLFGDSFGDHAQIAGVPPIVTKGRRGQGRLYLEPLVELQTKRDGDIKWLNPPQYPIVIDKMYELAKRHGDEYFGRPAEGVPESTVQLHRQFKVLWWLVNLREVYRQILQLAQQYLPDSILARVTNVQGEAILRSREEIQGQFDLQLAFDPQVMDPEYVEKMGGILRDILLAIDRDKTIATAPIVSTFMYWLFPDMAAESLRTVDEANESEVMDELERYLQIRGGVEPERVDDGSQNYALRLELYQRLQAANPEVFEDLSEDKRAILQAHLEHLSSMTQQYGANVQIGREGAKRAELTAGRAEA